MKSLFDVADNLERAAGAVPGKVLTGEEEVERDRALALLKGLHEGVQLTERILLQVRAWAHYESCMVASVLFALNAGRMTSLHHHGCLLVNL